MSLTKTQKLTLYSLGECYSRLNKRFGNAPLQVFISKIGFIEMMINSGLVEKKERALYKNLETLEKKKLVYYEDRNLRFTKRGFVHYNKIKKDIEPFLAVNKFLKNIKTNRRLQTKLSHKE